jgi:hypothetical protein
MRAVRAALRTALRWTGYVVCWLGVLIVIAWFGLAVFGWGTVANWW